MKVSDILVVTVLYLIGFFFLSMTLALPDPAQTYPLVLISALLVLNTVFLAVTVTRWRRAGGCLNDLPSVFDGFLPKQFFGLVIGILAYLALMPILGYYLASFAYLVLSLLFLRVPLRWTALTLVILLSVIWLVFSTFLKVPLPAGIFFS